MQILIKARVTEAARFIAAIHERHIPFATVLAATMTAKQVKLDEIREMRRVFDRPTPYVLNSLAVVPATLQRPTATVETDLRSPGKGTPAKRFLNPQIHGGGRSQKSHEVKLAALLGTAYMVPGKEMPLNSHGNVTGSTFMRIVSQLKVAGDQSASNSAKSKRKRRTDAFFKLNGRPIIMQRKGSDVRPALVGTKAPHYEKRFPFYEVAASTVEREFPKQFVAALERAIAKGNSRGKW